MVSPGRGNTSLNVVRSTFALPTTATRGCLVIDSFLLSRERLTRTHLINARRSRRRQDLLNEILETEPNHQFPAVADTETLWLLGHKTIYETTSSLQDARYAAKTLRNMNHKFAGRSASRRTNHGYQ